MTDFVSFLRKQTPLCMGLPFYKELVNSNLYYKLAERSELDFNGRNMFEQGCPNARVCDDVCLGRPIPAYPELDAIMAKYEATKGTWNGKDVWFLKVDTCKSCPFKGNCTKLCPAMGAFDGRNKNRDDFFLELASPIEQISDDWMETLYQEEGSEVWHSQMHLTSDDIAWDCLTEPQKAAVMMIQVQGLTYDQASSKLGIYKRAIQTSYESGMARLKEYGLARRALRADPSCPFAVDYYLNGIDLKGLADTFGVSIGLAHKKLTTFRKKHGISD